MGVRRVTLYAVIALTLLAAVLGLGVGAVVNRVAVRERVWRRRGDLPGDGVPPSQPGDRWGSAVVAEAARTRRLAVRPPVVEVGTAALFALTAYRFGWSWELPAFLLLAGAGVLLTVIDLRHRLLPDRVVLPSLAAGGLLLGLCAAAEQVWSPLLRALLGAVVLFVAFLVLALVSPRSLGMGDVKLAGLLGLYLGWLGWGALVLGAAAGFVVQAVVALALLAARRIGLRGELPFGPAMLLGAALAIGWGAPLLG